MAVHEILILDPALRHMIHNGENLDDMREYAQTAGMTTIADATLRIVKNGVTSITEMIDIVHGL